MRNALKINSFFIRVSGVLGDLYLYVLRKCLKLAEAMRAWEDIDQLQERQRELELRIERMDAMMQLMNGKRRK